jgi:hypothetical protein
MAQICKALKILIIDACYQDVPGLISLIDAQRDLMIHPNSNKKGICKDISKVLARKNNTIIFLYLETVNIIPPSFLTSLVNLKKLTITNHEEWYHQTTKEDIKYLRQCLANSSFLCFWFTMFQRICNVN